MRKWTLTIGMVAAAAGTLMAQTSQRKATLVNGGNPNGGKCTVEVNVDGSAEVEIRGDTATLRNTGGQAPQWRRFECTGAMPANPQNFRFAGVDGRGSQSLVRGPGNNGGPVIRIQDSQGGTEAYTFDVFWGDGGGQFSQDRFPQDRRPGSVPQGPGDRPYDNRAQAGPAPYDRGDFRGDGRGDYRGDGRGSSRFTTAQAVNVCEDYVRQQAVTRFRTQNINFNRVRADDNPGRQDWVLGELAVARRFGRQDIYRFSCSVNFGTGQVRSAQIDQFQQNTYPQGR